jgi:hypothetical protein
MALRGNLLSTINPTGLPGDEIATFVRAFFGSACEIDDAKVIRCPMHAPYAVRMQYDKKGQLTGVIAESALTQDTLTELRQRIHAELVVGVGTGFRREVLFSSAKVEGCWRYRDWFQILPVPEHAPRPADLSGSHPLLLECSYQRTGDFGTNVV